MKAKPNELINEIAGNLNQYLMTGYIAPLANKIDPNLNIEDIRKLLRIHFVLTKSNDNWPGVIDFIEKLPDRIRRVKTITKQDPEICLGEVRGRIKWNCTKTVRYNRNPRDETIFVCDEIVRNYDIPENLVLKSLLKIIHDIVYDDLNFAFDKNHTPVYDWGKDWFKEGISLRDTLYKTYYSNIYLKRVSQTNTKITNKMIDKALKSRIALYRDAAKLYIRFNKLMAFELNEDEAKELLYNTFIWPDRADVLFEFYWIVKIIKQYGNAKLHFINQDRYNRNLVAEWDYEEDNEKYTYRIYHNSILDFQFKENVESITDDLKHFDNYIGREIKILKKLGEMIHINDDSLWGGRPDIILEKCKNGMRIQILIGEVKYTDDKKYAIQGLRQLLEYLAFIKEKGIYIEKYYDIMDNLQKVKGCLFLDNVIDLNIESNKIYVIKYSDDFNVLFERMNF